MNREERLKQARNHAMLAALNNTFEKQTYKQL